MELFQDNFCTRYYLKSTNLGEKTQGDQSGEPKRRQMIGSSDEGEEVFKGTFCLAI